jgi:endonuclease/exonuclease/phosphatase family metal-dependent hydrolase
MMNTSSPLRVVTYNIHKCRGFDGKTSPSRIIDVIRELEADILCLQEVVNAPRARPIYNQAHEISKAFPDYEWSFGGNRPLRGGIYGNMTLARRPMRGSRNHNLSRQGREERGVLQTDIALDNGQTLHVFNVHLGTGHMERRFQARLLMSEAVLGQTELSGPRLVVGDFNEWTRGLTTRLLRNAFQTFRPEHGLRYPRTYPGMLPMLSLDHCYYEPPLEFDSARLWRSSRALIASDHLPLVADFHLSKSSREEKTEQSTASHLRHARL